MAMARPVAMSLLLSRQVTNLRVHTLNLVNTRLVGISLLSIAYWAIDHRLESDVTGPPEATKGIISIYDIFGFRAQTLQGADIVATGNEQNRYKVFIPDWFKGKPCPMEW